MVPKFEAGKIEFEALVEIKTAYQDQFVGKDGKEVKYYRALIPGRHKLREVSITEVLYEQIMPILPGEVTVKAVFDANYGKLRLDTL